MENITSFINFWTQNVEFLMPILLSIFVLGVSLGIAGLFDDNLTRTSIILPASLLLYGMGFAGSPFGRELFWNLSAELLMGLAALIILFFYNVFESWASTLGMVFISSLLLLIFLNPEQPQANLFVNLSTGLIGAFLTVGLIRKEWAFSPQNRDKMLSAEMRRTRKTQSAEQEKIGDYYVLVTGTDEAALGQKTSFLKESNIETFDEQAIAFDEETGTYYQLVHGRILTVVKEPETVLLANHEARLRVLGYPDTVKRIFRQLQEVLEVGESPAKLEAPDPHLIHMEVKTNAPKVIFSDYLEKQIFLLARAWRHGDNEHLSAATDELLEWAKEMHFIKE